MKISHLGSSALLGALLAAAAHAEPASFRFVEPLQLDPYRWAVVTHVSTDGRVVAGYLQKNACAGSNPCPSYVGAHAFRQYELQWPEPIATLPSPMTDPQNRPTAISGNGASTFGRSHTTPYGNWEAFRNLYGQTTPLGVGDESPVGASHTGDVVLFEDSVMRGGVREPLASPLVYGDIFASDVTGDGRVIVGRVEYYYGEPEPCVWVDDVPELLPIPAGFEVASAAAVTDDGRTVVGGVASRAVRWIDGAPELILPESLYTERGWVYSYASDVSADGRVVLLQISSDGASSEPYLWDAANGPRRLWDVMHHDFRLTAAPTSGPVTAMSRDGTTFVGTSYAADHAPHGWVARLPVGCANGVDDDADGAVDLADPGCANGSDYSERGPGPQCDDGVDNEGDGSADFPDDPSCASAAQAVEGNCTDGLDNDEDGSVDLADPGCTSESDVDEKDAAFECDDGVDNDGDWNVDYPLDESCTAPDDLSEADCGDGFDNDLDGLVDLADHGCLDPTDPSEKAGTLPCDDGVDNDSDGEWDYPWDEGCATPGSLSESPACSDGLDNDGDGLTDWWEDPQCLGDPARLRERAGACGLGAELAAIVPLLAWLRSRRRPQ